MWRQCQNVLRAGFEPATYGYLHVPLQSTALPTELPEDGCNRSETGFAGPSGCLAPPHFGRDHFHFVAPLSSPQLEHRPSPTNDTTPSTILW